MPITRPLMIGLLLFFLGCAPQSQAKELPEWLPRYDVTMDLQLDQHQVKVHQRIRWTNRHQQPTDKLVFNVHSHYKVPEAEVGKLLKTLEIFRINPIDGYDPIGHACQIQKATLINPGKNPDVPLSFSFDDATHTALVVPLPHHVKPGESVTIVLDFLFRLPQKTGRWGQWKGVTFLSNWLPVLAYFDESGWVSTPYVPWHQPFFNESGNYHVQATLPADQVVGCTGSVIHCDKLPDGRKRLHIRATGVRDFAFLCSRRYREFVSYTKPTKRQPAVKLRVLAFPEHEHYARFMLRVAESSVPLYAHWFGTYPYPELTITESFFGWNGNECSTLVMIDERVFDMPHIGEKYVDYLVSHEICHQWWYNVVGTNGYCETWMDEALATYFSHRRANLIHGKNNTLLDYPKELRWLPNIKRNDYRSYGLYGTLGRGENSKVIQDLPEHGHLINLFSQAYDKGSRIVGTIEERLGEEAFYDFMSVVFENYKYRILRVADFQRELEAYTGRSWKEFFDHWLYGDGLSDWEVKKVKVEKVQADTSPKRERGTTPDKTIYQVQVLVQQNGKYTEPTTLGIGFTDEEKYAIRIPILPHLGELTLNEPVGKITALPENRYKIEVLLTKKPKQVAVDPDQVLIDTQPGNNFWKHPVRVRLTPLYTQLEETDLTASYDRWNLIAGPWVYFPTTGNPWYTRSATLGARVGGYRTQKFNGGGYLGYRTDFRDVVAGFDGIIQHTPFPKTEIGFNVEQRLATFQEGRDTAFRGTVYGRYVKQYGSSLYLQPFEYVEAFANYQDNFLPFSRNPAPGAVRFDDITSGGIHYHMNYLTPYWDPSAGIALDVTYAGGTTQLQNQSQSRAFHQVFGQVSFATTFPDLSKVWDHPVADWLSESKLAFRAFGAAATPEEGEFFTMGGGSLFRGYDQRERQGSMVWVASAEWRVPVLTDVRWDILDHAIGVRNVQAAMFYDVGNSYINGSQVDELAHALGLGVRFDIALFSFVERGILRIDVAKTLNDSTPLQIWLGFSQPF